MIRIVLALALAMLAGNAMAVDPRNPRVNEQNYQDCRRFPERCAGDDRNRNRRDYYRDNTRQGSGKYIYRGERRIWTDESR
ncbi:hypothetical protein GCM10010520_25380 [Rhizobium viscosum]|uniref:Transmembrane protein n=1 Tax=Rhizobium viscosum TaxID=1673 RepID=A0ABR9IJF4_RHIVS|nr:hypothetical protein [Rhizobium viscosum]MBE1503314.1 hypothetical protein [Rhizobium viscosum]